MPYIKKEERKHFKPSLELLAKTPLNHAGDLNYVLTCVCQIYLARTGDRYQNYNDVVGALEGTKLEMYRRRVAPYEDKKSKENGDVY